jgi:effector-binding domain-containing protein
MNNQEIVLKDVPQRKVLFLSCKGSWRQLPIMLTKLSEHLLLSGLEALGPPSGFYLNTLKDVTAEDLTWEVCYPIELNTPLFNDEQTRSGVREISSTKVASIIHKGSYRKTSSSYERLQNWIRTRKLTVCGPAEELYLTDIIQTHGEQEIEIRLPVSSV